MTLHLAYLRAREPDTAFTAHTAGGVVITPGEALSLAPAPPRAEPEDP